MSQMVRRGRYNNGPTLDSDGRPRIKDKDSLPPTEDGLVKGVMPEIDGPAILCECHTCGYGGIQDPWHGFFKLPQTDENKRRASQANRIFCPSCGSGDAYAIKDIREQMRRASKEEVEARAIVQAQELDELRAQNEELRQRLAMTGAPKREPVMAGEGQRKKSS